MAPTNPQNQTPQKSTPTPAAKTAEPEEPWTLSPTVERLQKENARLQAALDAAGVRVDPPAPVAPSFGMSEGTREELARTGKATDPFTGEKLTKEDLPS